MWNQYDDGYVEFDHISFLSFLIITDDIVKIGCIYLPTQINNELFWLYLLMFSI